MRLEQRIAVTAGQRAPNLTKRLKWVVTPSLRLVYRTLDRFAKVDPAPVIVSGYPKAGTTAIANLLASATDVGMRQDPFSAREWHPLADIMSGRITAEEIVARLPYHFAATIIKDPDFIFLLDGFHNIFPEAQFVFVIRDPREAIRSILDRVGVDGQKDELDVADKRRLSWLPGWQANLDPITQGVPEGNFIDALASKWAAAARCYLNASNNVHLVRYEDFVAAKADAIGSLTARLGFRRICDLKHEAHRVFQPRGSNRGGWVNALSVSNQHRITTHCQRIGQELGYDLFSP